VTLVPDRSALRASPEADLDLTVEQAILAELREVRTSSDQLKSQVRDLRTVLMGAADGDTQFGRLPMVEKGLKDLDARVAVLELAHVRAGVYSSVFSKTGGFLAGLIGAATTALADIIFRLIWHH